MSDRASYREALPLKNIYYRKQDAETSLAWLRGKGFLDMVKFVMCTMETRVHMMFYILTKGYTVPGIQGTHDKLNQI